MSILTFHKIIKLGNAWFLITVKELLVKSLRDYNVKHDKAIIIVKSTLIEETVNQIYKKRSNI